MTFKRKLIILYEMVETLQWLIIKYLQYLHNLQNQIVLLNHTICFCTNITYANIC